MTGTVYGRQPSPRAILWGLYEDEYARLGAIFPTSRVVEYLSDVRQAEFDVLVVRGYSIAEAEPHLFVVSIDPGELGRAEVSADWIGNDVDRFASWSSPPTASFGGSTNASEFVIPSGLPAPFARLARSDLLPLFDGSRPADDYGPDSVFEGQARHFLTFSGGLFYRDSRSVVGGATPLLMTTEPRVLAGVFRRAGNQADCLVLPDGADLVAWVTAAIEVWQEKDPARFPAPVGWAHSARWMAARERELAAALQEADAAWEALEAERLQSRAATVEAIAEARAEVDAAERQLITGTGDQLVAAVAAALEALGFEVENMDLVWNPKDMREDLRVREPGSAWEALAEVKGYTGGAAQKDLLSVAGRWVPRFTADEGRLPAAAWYIVNHFRKVDPDQRETGVAPGLVIDTRHLFDACQGVISGAVAAETVRESLRQSKGRWTPPV